MSEWGDSGVCKGEVGIVWTGEKVECKSVERVECEIGVYGWGETVSVGRECKWSEEKVECE